MTALMVNAEAVPPDLIQTTSRYIIDFAQASQLIFPPV